MIDIKGTHWFYLGLINTLFLIYIFFTDKLEDYSFLKNKYLISFCALFLISCLSVSVSINIAESIMKLTDIFNILISIIIVLYISNKRYVTIKFLLYIILSTLLIDLLVSYTQFYNINAVKEFSFQDTNDLRGFYGNRNIAAFSILSKLILLYILGVLNKNKIFKIMLFIITILSSYLFYILSSRGVYVAITLISGLLILSQLFSLMKYKKTKSIKISLPSAFVILVIGSMAYFNLTSDISGIKVERRVNSLVSESNQSVNERIRFWNQSIDYFLKRPLLGYGIGNWRIYSIEADKKDMYSYVVPYFTHNDFLEILVETGILGFISFVLFYFFIFKINYQQLILWIKNQADYTPVFLMCFLIIYIIDSNINFPMDRPAQYISVFFYLAILELNNKVKDSEKK